MLIIDGDVEGDELACQLEEYIDVRVVDNGIGAYEYWGSKGVDHRWEPELDTMTVQVVFKNAECIPVMGKSTKNGGGCDGEHSGRCCASCSEYEVEYQIELESIKRGEKPGDRTATYSVASR